MQQSFSSWVAGGAADQVKWPHSIGDWRVVSRRPCFARWAFLIDEGITMETSTTEAGLGLARADWFEAVLHHIALGAEVAGVAVIVAGAVVAAWTFATGLIRGADSGSLYHTFRITVARGILLGLEFLVAADIIGTVAVEPTLHNLYILGLIVLVRTFLSFSLEVEIEGRWPWRKNSPGR